MRKKEMWQTRNVTHEFNTRSDESGGKYISGYFSVFNSPYELWSGAQEIVAPGAFDGQLDKDVRCLADHDTRLVLGRTKAGTLTLRQDDKGLWGEVEINPNDGDAMNLYERVKRGDIDQCSFGFRITDEEFVEREDHVEWIIKQVELFEVSIVTFPAYEETSVSARKQDYDNIQKRKLEAGKRKTDEVMERIKGRLC